MVAMQTQQIDLERLSRLHQQLIELRQAVLNQAEALLLSMADRLTPEGGSPSARNLACYLALRSHDLRDLQDELTTFALSSLGRSEAHVLDTLDKLCLWLSMALDLPLPPVTTPPPVDFETGQTLLAQHIEALLGPLTQARPIHIMVTLPAFAATEYSLLEELLHIGVEWVRINCAHDDREAWARMVGHLRHAERVTGKHCRILFDLGGQKLRIGSLSSRPGILHLKRKRDRQGLTEAPAALILTASDMPLSTHESRPMLQLPAVWFEQLRPGDRLRFTDMRGKKRHLEVVERLEPNHLLAHCQRNAYLDASTEFQLLKHRSKERGEKNDQHFCADALPSEAISLLLHPGDRLLLLRDPAAEARIDEMPPAIPITLPQVLDFLKPGEPIWFDDGKIGGVIDQTDAVGTIVTITHTAPGGSQLRADKGINLPESLLDLPALTDQDRLDLDFIVNHADMVGFSFVQSLTDIDQLICALTERNAQRLPILLKIETRQAVTQLPSMLLGSLDRHPIAVMIARGDLAIEAGGERMAELQEEILWLCEAAHLPVIWATQVLENLTKKGVLSRPELTDAAASARADCVMLNKGPHIIEAVKTLDDILTRMQGHQRKKTARLRALHWSDRG